MNTIKNTIAKILPICALLAVASFSSAGVMSVSGGTMIDTGGNAKHVYIDHKGARTDSGSLTDAPRSFGGIYKNNVRISRNGSVYHVPTRQSF